MNLKPKKVLQIYNLPEALSPQGELYNHRRLHCFASKGLSCVTCGITGTILRKEQWNDGSIHIDLYAVNDIGHEVLMTIDHIIPKSKGGPNYMGNYQPMCTKCNTRKGNQYNDNCNPKTSN